MTIALQVPSWPHPLLDATNATNVYAAIREIKIFPGEQRYEFRVMVYLNQAAFAAGKQPIADLTFSNGVGGFPAWATVAANPSFTTPYGTLRDWIYSTIVSSDSRFTGSTNL